MLNSKATPFTHLPVSHNGYFDRDTPDHTGKTQFHHPVFPMMPGHFVDLCSIRLSIEKVFGFYQETEQVSKAIIPNISTCYFFRFSDWVNTK